MAAPARTAFMANRSRISAPEEFRSSRNCEPAVLGDVELEQELALEAPVARLARVDPVGLDLLADFLEVVLVLGLRGVERDRLALDAPTAASKPASACARLPKDAGRRRGLGGLARAVCVCPPTRSPPGPGGTAGGAARARGASAWRGPGGGGRRVGRLHGRRLGRLRQRIRRGRRRLGRRFGRRREAARPWPPASAAPERGGAAEPLAEPAGPWAARELSGRAEPWARAEPRPSSAPAQAARALSGPARPALRRGATDCRAALSPPACREPCRRGAAHRA